MSGFHISSLRLSIILRKRSHQRPSALSLSRGQTIGVPSTMRATWISALPRALLISHSISCRV